MQRWFSLLAALATSLWGGVLVAALGGWSDRAVGLWFGAAALVTLATHGWVVLALGVVPPPSGPAWVAVQVAKHRRKGAWFAAWGGSAAALSGVLAWVAGGAGWLVLVGAAGNLGFQPGLFVAEWLAIGASAGLTRLVLAGKSPEAGDRVLIRSD